MTTPSSSEASASTSAAPPRIFVSHSHADNDFGVRLVTELRTALGGDEDTVWFDISGGAHGGDSLWQKIEAEISARPIFIVVLSPDAVASKWVNDEINLAWTLKNLRPNRYIIPVLYKPCEMRPGLQTLLYISFLPPQTFEAGLASLVTAIHALAGTRPAPPSHPSVGAPTDRPRTSPTPTTPSAPADPQAAAVAELLPGIQDAYQQRDWHRLIDKADALLADAPDATPARVYRLLGEARAETGDFPRARAALDVALARTAPDATTLALAGRVCLRLNDPTAAESHFKRALARVDAPAERLPLLRDYAAVLIELKQWDELLRRTEEGARLAPNEAYWPRTRLRALTELHRDAEALALLRTLTDRPDATVTIDDWLARARLVRTVDGDTAAVNTEINAALDAAARLAGPTGATYPAIAAARRELFPPPAPPIPPDQFPERLASLGFVPHTGNDPQTGKAVPFIVPPTVPVPAGPFRMGKVNPRDPEAQYDGPARTVDIPAFAIARYPVTVAEYACFVRARQRQPPKGALGVDWRTQLTRLDHPVTGISWHDAGAYAAWLARLSGQPWRLPTEEEWEKAARWDPRTGTSRIYPWGDTFDAARCNTAESKIGTTTPVGTYGAPGASAVGAEDMAGNVWEWTDSRVDNSTDNRVLRGGSWDSVRLSARAAYWISLRPDYLLDDYGFRLVVALARAGL